MKVVLNLIPCVTCLMLMLSTTTAQETPPLQVPDAVSDAAKDVQEGTGEIVEESTDQFEKIKQDLDESETAKEVSAGILKPIYMLAEQISFPAFHWIAFALMMAGVVGYAFQLVFTKLVLLTRMSFSLAEILADAMGLAISLIGLILTTQAAAENSSFTQSAGAVLSSTVVGILVGLFLYRWGHVQEVDAATGRRVVVRKPRT